RSGRRLPRPPTGRVACEGPRPHLHPCRRARAPAAPRRTAEHPAIAGGTDPRAGGSTRAGVRGRAQTTECRPWHAGAAPAARAVSRGSPRARPPVRAAGRAVRALRSGPPRTAPAPRARQRLFPAVARRRGPRVMTDEIDQLLRSLHLKKIAAIIDEELAHAAQHQLSYSAFLA